MFADIRTRLAAALRDVGQIEQAAEELQQALVDKPQYLPARVQLGVCLYSLGRIDEAVAAWNEVLKQDPKNASASMYIKLVQGDRT